MEKKAWAIMATDTRIGLLPMNFGSYVVFASLEQAEAYIATIKKDDEHYNGYLKEITITFN